MSSSVIRRPSAAPERTTKSPCTHAPCSVLPQASRRSAAGCRDSHAVSLGQATPAAIARSSTSNIIAKVRGTLFDSGTRGTEASGERALRAGAAAKLDAAVGCPGCASWFSRHPLGANRQASVTAPPSSRSLFPSGSSFIPRWGQRTAWMPGCPPSQMSPFWVTAGWLENVGLCEPHHEARAAPLRLSTRCASRSTPLAGSRPRRTGSRPRVAGPHPATRPPP